MLFTENTTMQELMDNTTYWASIHIQEVDTPALNINTIVNKIWDKNILPIKKIDLISEAVLIHSTKRYNRKYIASRKFLIKDKRHLFYKAMPSPFSTIDKDIGKSKILQVDNLMESIKEYYPKLVWVEPIKIEALITDPLNYESEDTIYFSDIGNYVQNYSSDNIFRSLYKKDPEYPRMPLETLIVKSISELSQPLLNYSVSIGSRKTVKRLMDSSNNNKLFYGRKVYDNRFCAGFRLLPSNKRHWKNYEGVEKKLNKLILNEQLDSAYDTDKYYAEWEMYDFSPFYDLVNEPDISSYEYSIATYQEFPDWWNYSSNFRFNL